MPLEWLDFRCLSTQTSICNLKNLFTKPFEEEENVHNMIFHKANNMKRQREIENEEEAVIENRTYDTNI